MSESDSLHSVLNPDPETNTEEVNNNDSFMDFTCSDVKLNPGDTFVFMLGTLNKIEKYLDNLEDNHKKWLLRKVLILKTAFIRNCELFRSQIKDTNGTINIRNRDSKKNVNEKNLGESKEAKKQSLINQLQDESEHPLPMESEIETGDNVQPDVEFELNYRPSETVGGNIKGTHSKSKSRNKQPNLRRSERLQNIPEERKGLCADRMAYITWKMQQSKSTWLRKTDSQNSNETVKQKPQSETLVRNIFSEPAGEPKTGKVNAKRMAISGIKSSNKGEYKEDVQNNIKKIIRKKARNLGMNLNKNIACEATVSGVALKKMENQQNDKKVQIKKRAVSEGGPVSKKGSHVKKDESSLLQNCHAETQTTSFW